MSIDDLREKSINFWIRLVLRIMAWAVLMFYMIYRIMGALIQHKPVYLDANDGKVIIGCIAMLLAIEAVKLAVEKWVSKK